MAVVIVTALTLGSSPAAAADAPAAVPPKAWILVDLNRGLVLDASRPHQPLLVASAAKLMTALVAVDRLAPNALIPVDAVAASRPPTRIGMLAGQRWSREAALQAMLVVSANDAAYALATAAAGSLAEYGTVATAKAKALGLTDSTWADPAGLDGTDGYGSGNAVSAYDLAVLARAVLADPVLAPMVGHAQSVLIGPDGRKQTLFQHNKLLTTYSGAIGVKTGYTSSAGQVLVAAATREGRTFVAVTIGGYDLYGPSSKLLDQGFLSPTDAPGTGEWLPGSAPRVEPLTATATATAGAELVPRALLDRLDTPGGPLVAAVALATPGIGLIGLGIRRSRRRAL